MKKLILSALFAISGMLAYQASAQTYQWWDNGGSSPASSGNWDTTSTYWANSPALTASTVTFNNGNFPVFSAGSAGILNLTISVPGPVTCEGFGDATTNGTAAGAAVTNLTFNGVGPITLAAGSWEVECGNSAPSPVIVVNTPIAGPGGFVQHNSGSLALYGTNSYSGGTTITGGQILFYNNSASFGTGPFTNTSSSSIEISNGLTGIITLTNAFVMNDGGSVMNFASGNTTCSGPWYLLATSEIKNNGDGNYPLTISGTISGVSGAGIYPECDESNLASITISGSNTYTGPTGIGWAASGAITAVYVYSINSVSSPAPQPFSSLGDPSSVANGTISLGFTTYAGKLIYTGPGETSDRRFNLTGTTGGGTIEMDGAGPLIITGNIMATTNGAKTFVLQGSSTASNEIAGSISNSASGATILAKAGTGSWILAGTNPFTGGINVSNGTLIIGGSGDVGSGSFAGAITNNGTFIYGSTAGQTLSGALSGAGAFDMSGSNATLTLSAATGSTFTGLFTITSGAIAISADTNLGVPSATFLANDITLNGGSTASLRDTANITLNANRGITLGTNGGAIQVASGDTFTYNGIISGSGQFQDGLTASTGLGVLVLGGSESYTNTTDIACGTLRLSAAASLGNSAGILMSNSPTLDVSAINPFSLSTTNTLTVIGSSNTPTSPAIILGPSGGDVNFGSQTVNLSYAPLGINGDASHGVLSVSQGTLELSGNTINVTNASGSTLDVGNYDLIQSANGISLTSPTLNYIGNLVPNTVASLAVVGANTLVLQVIPTAGYAESTFTNQMPYPGQSAVYGTPTATFSGTVIGPGPSYPNMGETVNIAIPNVETNTAMISDSTGDFSLTMPINTVPVGTYAVTYSYPGTNGTLAPATDSSTSLTITKAALAIGATSQTKTYGQTIITNDSTAFTNSATQNGETIGGVTLTVSSSGNASNAPVSIPSGYTITPSAATGGTFSAANYSITYITNTLTVNPLPVGVGGTNTYNGSTTVAYTSLSITNIVPGDVVTLTAGSATLVASAAGVEPIVSITGLTLGGARDTNYTTLGATYGSVTVKPLPVVLTGTNVYNGTTSAAYTILSISNVVGSDDVTLTAGSATLAASAIGLEPISSAAGLTLSGVTAGNYTTTGATGAVRVTQLPVGLNGTNTYNGTAIAAFSILSITNIAGTDVVNLASGSVTLASSAAGIEPITSASSLVLSGARATNYTTTGATGAVTVNPLPVGLTGTRAYDGTATAAYSILSITNVVGDDDVSLASGSATLAASTVGSEPITSAAGLTLAGATAGNYTTIGATGAVTITNPYLPFSILSIQVVNNNVVVVFQSVPGVTYQMLSSSDVSLPLTSWTAAGTSITATGVTATNIVPVSGTNEFFIIQN